MQLQLSIYGYWKLGLKGYFIKLQNIQVSHYTAVNIHFNWSLLVLLLLWKQSEQNQNADYLAEVRRVLTSFRIKIWIWDTWCLLVTYDKWLWILDILVIFLYYMPWKSDSIHFASHASHSSFLFVPFYLQTLLVHFMIWNDACFKSQNMLIWDWAYCWQSMLPQQNGACPVTKWLLNIAENKTPLYSSLSVERDY